MDDFEVFPVYYESKLGPFTHRCIAENERDSFIAFADGLSRSDPRRVVAATKAHERQKRVDFWAKKPNAQEGVYPFYGWDPRLNHLLAASQNG